MTGKVNWMIPKVNYISVRKSLTKQTFEECKYRGATLPNVAWVIFQISGLNKYLQVIRRPPIRLLRATGTDFKVE